jgi:hypothetical protein
MLDRLEQFPWSQVRHAYGSADDVPEMVRALLTDDPKQRDDAAWKIYNKLNHQSDVYPATLPLTPFLIEMLTVDSMPARAEVLGLLLGFAVGAIAEPHRYDRLGMTDDEIEREVIAQNALVKNIREAVKVGLPLYRQLLDDPEPKTRQEAARLLTVFGENFIEIIGWLRERIEIEPDPDVKAYLLKQFARMFLTHPLKPTHPLWQSVPMFIRALTSDHSAVVRLQALCAWTHLKQDATTSTDVSVLVSSYGEWVGSAESDFLRWCMIYNVCFALPALGLERGVSAFLEVARFTPVEEVYSVLSDMLKLAFPAPISTSHPLSTVQKLVLSELVAHDEWWIERPDDDGKTRNAIPWMRDYGLPDDREALRQVLSS